MKYKGIIKRQGRRHHQKKSLYRNIYMNVYMKYFSFMKRMETLALLYLLLFPKEVILAEVRHDF